MREPRVRHQRLSRVAAPCSVVLSILARASAREHRVASRAFACAAEILGLPELEPLVPEQAGLGQLDRALAVLSGLSPELKRRLRSACAECVAFDHQISTEEAELFRAIADTLGCPVPPLLPGQLLA